LCTLLAAVGVVFLVVQRFVVRPVTASITLAQEIARNNLSVDDIGVNSGDEVGEAVVALNSMKNNLHSVVENIAATAGRIASAGHELASRSAEQSAAAGAQTDRTVQVATAMHEMSSTVTHVSESAQQAAGSEKATETAHAGGMPWKIPPPTCVPSLRLLRRWPQGYENLERVPIRLARSLP
jgi:methyl-accepting chemotaxis protein